MRYITLVSGLLLMTTLSSLADNKKEPAKAPTSYFKAEVRGTLRITQKVEVLSVTLGQELAKQPVNAVIGTAGTDNAIGFGSMYLAFGDNKELAALAQKQDGKTVIIIGELRRAYTGLYQGIPPRFDDYIQVASIKAAE